MKLQIGIIIGAVVVVFVAVLILIGVLPGLRTGEEGRRSTLVMWGFDDSRVFSDAFQEYSQDKSNIQVEYSQKSPVTFESELLNAIARGESPDILVFPSDLLMEKHQDKLSAAPPILVTEREIKLDFVPAAEAFLRGKEIIGIPLYGDALLLYWNQDLFTQNFITIPPKTWDEFLDTAVKLTKKDAAGNILIAGAALGRGLNIKHAHQILAALFLQSGERITIKKESGAREIVLGEPIRVGEASLNPAESALRFISDFSNPRKSSQSWSGALIEAKEMFLAGKLGMYIGLMSEFGEIKNKNPHLAFSISTLPQLKDAKEFITSGTLFALSVPKASTNQRQAWEFIKFLTAREQSSKSADIKNTVSPRRDLLSNYQKEAARSVFAESLLRLKLWPNPDPARTEEIFNGLIEDIALGRGTLRDNLNKAKARLQEI